MQEAPFNTIHQIEQYVALRDTLLLLFLKQPHFAFVFYTKFVVSLRRRKTSGGETGWQCPIQTARPCLHQRVMLIHPVPCRMLGGVAVFVAL